MICYVITDCQVVGVDLSAEMLKIAEQRRQASAHAARISYVLADVKSLPFEDAAFDTVCSNGHVLYQNVAWYRPKPLVLAKNPWISMQNIVLRDVSVPLAKPGVELGMQVHEALGFQTGFTHMEWFHTPSGEAVFGEIGARAAGV